MYLTNLRGKTIIEDSSQLSYETLHEMDVMINKHNVKHYGETIAQYKKGKHEYSLTVRSLVWDEQKGTRYTDRREIEIKTDLETRELTRDVVKEIAMTFYHDLDDPEFENLIKGKTAFTITKLDPNADMKT